MSFLLLVVMCAPKTGPTDRFVSSRRAEEQSVGALCREHSIAAVTFYRWRKKYGGMSVSAAARPRELEREHARLKRLLAERDRELDATKELLAKK